MVNDDRMLLILFYSQIFDHSWWTPLLTLLSLRINKPMGKWHRWLRRYCLLPCNWWKRLAQSAWHCIVSSNPFSTRMMPCPSFPALPHFWTKKTRTHLGRTYWSIIKTEENYPNLPQHIICAHPDFDPARFVVGMTLQLLSLLVLSIQRLKHMSHMQCAIANFRHRGRLGEQQSWMVQHQKWPDLLGLRADQRLPTTSTNGIHLCSFCDSLKESHAWKNHVSSSERF